MTKIIQTTIMAIAIVLFPLLAWTQTAAILPLGQTQFFDNNGNPLSSGTVDFYIPNTTTRKTTWQDAAEIIPNTNPVVLNAAGRAIIYGDGVYRQVLKDRNGNIIWDAVTSGFGSSSPTLVGDGNTVGTILPWSGLIAPTHYVFSYGQELSRVTYITLYGVLTLSSILNCTSASAVLSGLSDTTQIPIGAPVEATCVAAGSTVLSKTASSVTVSNNASVTATITARFFPYGNGNGTTTFNVPDLRGRALAGRDNMGGTVANRLTVSSFATPGTGATGGQQSSILISSNLPAYTPTGTIVSSVTDPGHSHTYNQGISNNQSAVASGHTTLDALIGTTTGLSVTGITVSSTFAGTAQGGTSTGFTNVQPTITLNYIIKVLTDTSLSTSVVTSIQSMTGDITCTAPIVCSGQTIASSIGVGDVIGPGASTDNAIARFDSTTGKLIQNSTVIVSDAGALTTTVPDGDGVNVFSGASGSYANFTIGRTSNEFNIGVAGLANQFFAGTGLVAGDAVIKAATNLWLGTVSGGNLVGFKIDTAGAVTAYHGITSILPNADALNVRSGAAGSYANMTIGRTAAEFSIGVVAVANQFTTIGGGTSVGDAVVKSDSNLWLLAGGGAAPKGIKIDTTGNFILNTNTADVFPFPADIGNGIRVQCPNATNCAIDTATYGVGQFAVYAGFNARGTAAAPLASRVGDNTLIVNGHPYGTSNWMGGNAQIRFTVATPICTNTDCGMNLDFLTVVQADAAQSPLLRYRITDAGRHGFGTDTPQAFIHLNSNTKQNIPISAQNEMLKISAGDNGNAFIDLDSFGTANVQFSGINLRQARGTAASPLPLLANTTVAVFTSGGYDASGGSGYALGRTSITTITGSSNWSAGVNTGMLMAFTTTPNGTNTPAESFRATSLGGLAVGLTTETAAGVVRVNTGFIQGTMTAGRILKSNGTNFVSGLLDAPQFTVVITGTDATYTTPTGATRLEIEGVGGGGGGAGSGTTPGAATSGGDTCVAASGTACTSSLLKGTGGTLGRVDGGACTVGTGTTGTLTETDNQDGGISQPGVGVNLTPGGVGGSSRYGGKGPGGVPAAAGLPAAPNSGSGGGGGGTNATSNTGGGGCAGGWFYMLITSPAASYTYTVGAAGAAGTAGGGGFAGGAGASGKLSIKAYFN